MFAAISRFEIENDMEEAVKNAFINRPGLVENHPGFKRLDVISPVDNPAEIWLITYWSDKETFEKWHKNHLKDSHKMIPKGLKLKSRSFSLQYFEHVSC